MGGSGVHPDKEWLLPLLKACVRYSNPPLGYFAGPLLHAAKLCVDAKKAATDAGQSNAAQVKRPTTVLAHPPVKLTRRFPPDVQTHHLRCEQLWSLFPSFCASPCDVQKAFTQQLGQMLTTAMSDARCQLS